MSLEKNSFELCYCLDLKHNIGKEITKMSGEVYRWQAMDACGDLLYDYEDIEEILKTDSDWLHRLNKSYLNHLNDEGFYLIDKSMDILPHVADCLRELFNRKFPQLLEYGIIIKFYDSLNDLERGENETLVYVHNEN